MGTEAQTSNDVLYAGIIQEIAALIAACRFPGDAFFLAERLPQRVITDEQERQDLLRFAHVGELGEQLNPADYTSGRIFCPDFELRWSQVSEKETRIVYLGPIGTWLDTIAQRVKMEKQPPSLTHYTQRYYYLFGESLDKDRLKQMGLEEVEEYRYYAEVRIPRLLRYPKRKGDSGKQRVQLVVREYLNEQTGSIDCFRFLDLKVAEEKA